MAAADPFDPFDPTAPPHAGPPTDPPDDDDDDGDAVAAMKAELDRLKAENARMKKGLHPVAPPAFVPPPTTPAVPGDGPVLWEGHLNGDPTAPKVTFRGTASEAEAREAYLHHAGITGTDKTVKVAKVGEESPPAAAADGLKPKAKPKKK
jgi:hypothetical protein